MDKLYNGLQTAGLLAASVYLLLHAHPLAGGFLLFVACGTLVLYGVKK